MQPKIEVVSPELILVHGVVTVNYDQTPAQAIEGLPYNNPLIATDYPQELWSDGNDGKTEKLEKEVTIPLYTPRRQFSTAEGRNLQRKIGYGIPADLVPLAEKDVCRALVKEDIWWIVSLRENDEELLLDSRGDRRPVYLLLYSSYRGFSLSFAGDGWDGSFALVGAPQVS